MKMKKLLTVVACLVIGTAAFAKKTTNGTELGVRFIGGYYSSGIGMDMAFAAGNAGRIHADVDFIGGGLAANCLYNWLFPIPELPALVFYPGVGGGMWMGEGFNASVVGAAGLEYGFDFPMTLGLEFRPRFDILTNQDFHSEMGLMVRYRL